MAQSSFSDAFSALNAALDAGGDTVVVLPLGAVVEDPNNPRSVFDEAELAALAQTIREKGVLQPITVRPPGPDGRHVIRFGARRFRAAQLAGVGEIRALVQGGDDGEESLLIEQLIENDQREPLNTADLARAVEKLLALKLNQSEIARRLGRPRDQIALLASVRTMPRELTVIASAVGVRTLFELNAAWKADPPRVRSWLADRDPATITQSEARRLADRPPPRRLVRNPVDGSVEGVGAPPPPDAPQRTRATARKTPAPAPRPHLAPEIEVETQEGAGVLVLDGVRRATDRVRVRLTDGRVVTVAAPDVRLVRLRPG